MKTKPPETLKLDLINLNEGGRSRSPEGILKWFPDFRHG